MSRRLKWGASAVALAGFLAAAVHGAGSGDVFELLMCFGPFVLLAIPLLSGRYVGEQLLTEVRNRRRPARRRAARSVAIPAWFSRATVDHGRLFACAHSERGPPAACRA
jgi:hypothetical protein